jgi:hypothetical protein
MLAWVVDEIKELHGTDAEEAAAESADNGG